MGFAVATKNTMLDGVTATGMKIHSGDPGADGTANTEGGPIACTFGAAATGSRALSGTVSFTGLTPDVVCTYYSVWNGGTYEGSSALLQGDNAANAEGNFDVTAATMNINDA